jgi:hypothetical protein
LTIAPLRLESRGRWAIVSERMHHRTMEEHHDET